MSIHFEVTGQWRSLKTIRASGRRDWAKIRRKKRPEDPNCVEVDMAKLNFELNCSVFYNKQVRNIIA